MSDTFPAEEILNVRSTRRLKNLIFYTAVELCDGPKAEVEIAQYTSRTNC